MECVLPHAQLELVHEIGREHLIEVQAELREQVGEGAL